eukprot:CAMPEP_0194358586 /NCGR_PEP_ID=MMETSP0174-20130528/5734_1 /TAXON_ID=216777 /ORGANISM="Proboscia alata, Strain PI-D3" /LENGTH=1694 /DNA_ID=CAMNT_0039128931 /DNA_START=492 /DNA_END=5576 /DNA_ORIENTATION=+
MIGSRIAEMKKLYSPGFSPSRSCQDKFPATVGEDEEVNLSNPNLSVNGNQNRGNSINGDVKSSFHRAAAGEENDAGSEEGVGIKLSRSFDYTSSPYYIAHKSAVSMGSNMPRSPSSSRNKGGEPPPPPPISGISTFKSFDGNKTASSASKIMSNVLKGAIQSNNVKHRFNSHSSSSSVFRRHTVAHTTAETEEVSHDRISRRGSVSTNSNKVNISNSLAHTTAKTENFSHSRISHRVGSTSVSSNKINSKMTQGQVRASVFFRSSDGSEPSLEKNLLQKETESDENGASSITSNATSSLASTDGGPHSTIAKLRKALDETSSQTSQVQSAKFHSDLTIVQLRKQVHQLEDCATKNSPSSKYPIEELKKSHQIEIQEMENRLLHKQSDRDAMWEEIVHDAEVKLETVSNQHESKTQAHQDEMARVQAELNGWEAKIDSLNDALQKRENHYAKKLKDLKELISGKDSDVEFWKRKSSDAEGDEISRQNEAKRWKKEHDKWKQQHSQKKLALTKCETELKNVTLKRNEYEMKLSYMNGQHQTAERKRREERVKFEDDMLRAEKKHNELLMKSHFLEEEKKCLAGKMNKIESDFDEISISASKVEDNMQRQIQNLKKEKEESVKSHEVKDQKLKILKEAKIKISGKLSTLEIKTSSIRDELDERVKMYKRLQEAFQKSEEKNTLFGKVNSGHLKTILTLKRENKSIEQKLKVVSISSTKLQKSLDKIHDDQAMSKVRSGASVCAMQHAVEIAEKKLAEAVSNVKDSHEIIATKEELEQFLRLELEESRDREIELRNVLDKDPDDGRVAVAALQLSVNEANKKLEKVGCELTGALRSAKAGERKLIKSEHELQHMKKCLVTPKNANKKWVQVNEKKAINERNAGISQSDESILAPPSPPGACITKPTLVSTSSAGRKFGRDRENVFLQELHDKEDLIHELSAELRNMKSDASRPTQLRKNLSTRCLTAGLCSNCGGNINSQSPTDTPQPKRVRRNEENELAVSENDEDENGACHEADEKISQMQEDLDEANDTINTKNQLELMLRESLRETLGMLKPLQQHITFTEQNIRGLKRRLGSAQLLTYETDDKLKQVTEELKSEKALTSTGESSAENSQQFKKVIRDIDLKLRELEGQLKAQPCWNLGGSSSPKAKWNMPLVDALRRSAGGAIDAYRGMSHGDDLSVSTAGTSKSVDHQGLVQRINLAMDAVVSFQDQVTSFREELKKCEDERDRLASRLSTSSSGNPVPVVLEKKSSLRKLFGDTSDKLTTSNDEQNFEKMLQEESQRFQETEKSMKKVNVDLQKSHDHWAASTCLAQKELGEIIIKNQEANTRVVTLETELLHLEKRIDAKDHTEEILRKALKETLGLMKPMQKQLTRSQSLPEEGSRKEDLSTGKEDQRDSNESRNEAIDPLGKALECISHVSSIQNFNDESSYDTIFDTPKCVSKKHLNADRLGIMSLTEAMAVSSPVDLFLQHEHLSKSIDDLQRQRDIIKRDSTTTSSLAKASSNGKVAKLEEELREMEKNYTVTKENLVEELSNKIGLQGGLKTMEHDITAKTDEVNILRKTLAEREDELRTSRIETSNALVKLEHLKYNPKQKPLALPTSAPSKDEEASLGGIVENDFLATMPFSEKIKMMNSGKSSLKRYRSGQFSRPRSDSDDTVNETSNLTPKSSVGSSSALNRFLAHVKACDDAEQNDGEK